MLVNFAGSISVSKISILTAEGFYNLAFKILQYSKLPALKQSQIVFILEEKGIHIMKTLKVHTNTLHLNTFIIKHLSTVVFTSFNTQIKLV